ncbi:MAG: hypothetical protein IPP59_09340 [Betaproteobacteria bacterium]|nr:hypothetical protein [Candidatus Dechloromonas phosphorivorans]
MFWFLSDEAGAYKFFDRIFVGNRARAGLLQIRRNARIVSFHARAESGRPAWIPACAHNFKPFINLNPTEHLACRNTPFSPVWRESLEAFLIAGILYAWLRCQ